MHFELEFFIIICFNYKILQLSLRLGFLLAKKINTVKCLYNEVLGIMIDFLYLSNSKIYEKKLNITKLHYIIMVNTFCQSLGPLLNRCSKLAVMNNSLNKKNCQAKQAEQESSSFLNLFPCYFPWLISQ